MNTPEEYIAAMQPKLCINCKHIGRNGSGDAKQYKCFAPQNIRSETTDLVTGLSSKMFNANTCYEARQPGWCGAKGSWFEDKPTMEVVPTGKPGEYTSRPIKEHVAADLLSQLDRMK